MDHNIKPHSNPLHISGFKLAAAIQHNSIMIMPNFTGEFQ